MKSKLRFAVVAVAILLSPVPAAWSAEKAARPAKPNILLIVADDQGYNDLGSLPGSGIQTPNLDRLAKEGVRLTNFYVTWPACTPSRGSILTGRYPQRNGLYAMIRNDMVNYGHRYTEFEYSISPEMTLGLDLREITVAQVLRKAGYATGAVGKWDSGRAKRFLPLQRGFDFFYGFANTGIDYWTHERYGVPSMFRGNQPITETGYSTDLFRREAVHFVRQHRDRPFFLYLPFNAPHSGANLAQDWWQAPAEYIRKYPGCDPKQNRTKYMAMVTCMDDAIGQLLATLKELGIDQNTFILFFSDNGGGGPCDNTPLRGHKSQMFEGGLRVLSLARWPGRIPAGQVSGELLTTLEVLPTLAAMAGAQRPTGVTLDGFDMLSVLQGRAKSARTEMFWEHQGEKAVRVGDYKWLESQAGSGLYDLARDVGEKHDLSAEKPEVLQRLRARYDAWKREMDAAEPRGPFRDY
jgi:arylsulfatase A-like enzyme